LPEATEKLSRRLRRQAAWCAELGSPFYASLLESAADDLVTGGPVAGVLSGFEDESGAAALALRLMGALHRLVLEDSLPDLAQHYPSTGGDGDAAAAWPLFRQALVDNGDRVRRLLAGGCQTNEVGRSAALLGRLSRGGASVAKAPANPRDRRERRPEPPLGPLPVRVQRRRLGRRGLAPPLHALL
jgi:hypothetical protein